MAKIDDIVKAIDNKLLETGKEHLILQQASKLLLSLGIIESTKELKQILERGEIPHAYKTNTSPRQWLLPLSEERRSRKTTPNNKKKSKSSKKTTKTNTTIQESQPSKGFPIILAITGIICILFIFVSYCIYEEPIEEPTPPLTVEQELRLLQETIKRLGSTPLDTIIITKFNNTTPPKPKSIEELKNNDKKQTK